MSMAHAQQLAAKCVGEVLKGHNLNEILAQIIQQQPTLSATTLSKTLAQHNKCLYTASTYDLAC